MSSVDVTKDYKQCMGIKRVIDKYIECVREFIKEDPDEALYFLDCLKSNTDLLAEIGNEYETAVVKQIERNREKIMKGLI